MEPFIYKFKTNNYKYIYDVNTNRVFQVADLTYSIIDNYSDDLELQNITLQYPGNDIEDLKKSIKEIKNAQANGIFSYHRPLKMSYWYGNSFNTLYEFQKHEQLILNVTERCNLRCKYCIYSGKYKNKRTHSKRDISFETAKKAINFFFNNSKDEVYISFYGGEPLLNFSLIKQVIEYVEERTIKRVNWNITTNGTLLTPNICKYIYEKKIILTVSLDGPKEIHDRYRVTIEGNKTFKKIMDNLKYLYNIDKDFYIKNVSFNAVSAPPYKLSLVEEFFNTETLVMKNNMSFYYMNSTIKNFESDFSINDYNYDLLMKDNQKLEDEYKYQVKIGESKYKIAKQLYERNILRFYKRSKSQLGDIIGPNGCCVAGFRRVFVGVDGTLNVCEKMDNAYSIGSIDEWLDMDSIKKLYEEYFKISNNCLNCWACRLCSTCFASAITGGKLDEQSRSSLCDNIRDQFHQMLVLYYSILEENESAFDYMSKMTIE